MLFHYLELYTEQDWNLVSYTNSRLSSLIQEDLYGFTVRSRIKDHAKLEKGSLYYVSKEVKRGEVTNSRSANTARGPRSQMALLSLRSIF